MFIGVLFCASCVDGTVPEDQSDGATDSGADAVDAIDDTGDDEDTAEDDGSTSDATADAAEDTGPDTAQDTGADAEDTGPDIEQDTGPDCPDEPCAQGDSQCTSDGRVQGCVRGNDGCLTWGSPTQCSGGQCVNGQCANCQDNDGDGYGENCGAGTDCNDNNSDVYAMAPELCDGIDNDCDNQTDEPYGQLGQTCTVTQNGCTGSGTYVCNASMDGVTCDGTVTTSTEVCDGVDNDCDGETDEGFAQLGQSCSVSQNGCTASGNYVCNGAGDDVECDATVMTSGEVCDGQDNDCDGEVDEDFGQLGQSCTVTQNGCTGSGTYVCNGSGNGVECDGTVQTSPETCDGVDNDCDGQIDEDYGNLGTACQNGAGICAVSGQIICDPNNQWSTTCDAGSPNTQLAVRETCDDRDEDCDGQVDENACFACVEDTYEENDSSTTGTDLTSNGTVSNVTLCGSFGTDQDPDWFELGPGAIGASVQVSYPNGSNAVGASYPDLQVDVFCDSSYCTTISGAGGNLAGPIPDCGTCNYTFYVYTPGSNPASGTPYEVTRQ